MSAYVVLIRERTTDAAELALYRQKAAAARAGHDITPLASYGAFEVLEGASMEGAVILRFPSVEAARSWYASPDYQNALPHRLKGADCRMFLIEGVDATTSA